jgi:hypothetical protein
VYVYIYGNVTRQLLVSKMSWFSFYILSFFFFKIREQEGGRGPAQGGRLAPVGGVR